jgi:branched-chain amino acid transport system ATP-binding protein
MMLKIEHLDAYYVDSHILHDISMEVFEGEVVALLGRNGVGKTTTLKSVMGVTRINGSISFCGNNITELPTFKIARLGIAYVPEDRRIFPNLPVHMNLKIAIRKSKGDRWSIEKIYSLFPRLEERENHKGDELSGGEQQMLAIARALLGNPNLILMDEPTEGLAPLVIKMVIRTILELKGEGLTILLAEQNSKVALSVSERCYVLIDGRIVFQGKCGELTNNQSLAEKLLAVS